MQGRLRAFALNVRRLPGIQAPVRRAVFLSQVIESVHRVRYISAVGRRDIAQGRSDPNNHLFDPLRAAILHQRAGNIDEACWLVFLSVHFGKHGRAGWRLARDVYGALGTNPWTWQRVSVAPRNFRRWLRGSIIRLKGDGVLRRFGNHRKYLSLDADSRRGTGEAVETYVRWVLTAGNHERLLQGVIAQAGGDPRVAFDLLYNSMRAVTTFGRMARFDYLTMLGKLELAPIEPGSPYLEGATGPYDGARLLFGRAQTARVNRHDLGTWIVALGDQVGLGMQVLEDALRNWQKSPQRFLRFRG